MSVHTTVANLAFALAAALKGALAANDESIKTTGKDLIAPSEAKSLAALVKRLEDLAAAAMSNDSKAVRQLCDFLDKPELLAEYEAQEEDSTPSP